MQLKTLHGIYNWDNRMKLEKGHKKSRRRRRKDEIKLESNTTERSEYLILTFHHILLYSSQYFVNMLIVYLLLTISDTLQKQICRLGGNKGNLHIMRKHLR